MKQSKQEALAEVLPKKSSKSNVSVVPSPKNVGNKGIVKEDLICKIIKYQNNRRFGPIIKKELGFKYNRPQLTKYSIDHLETILHRIRTHLNTRNMDQVFEHMAKVTAKGYEDLVTGFGYNIEGFSDLLIGNPAFHDAFERWKIERKIPDIPPSFQLVYIIASTTYMAHLQNAKHKKVIEPPSMENNDLEIVDDKPINNNNKDDNNKNLEKLKSNFKPGDII